MEPQESQPTNQDAGVAPAAKPVAPPSHEPARGSIAMAMILLIVGATVFATIVVALGFAGIYFMRSLGRQGSQPAAAPVAVTPVAPPIVMPEAVAPAPPPPASVNTALTPPAPGITAPPPPAAPSAPMPTVTVMPSAPQPPAGPANPEIVDFAPTVAGPGTSVVVNGRGLSATVDMILFPRNGSQPLAADFHVVTDNHLVFTMPPIDDPQDGYYLAVFSLKGAALLVDSKVHTTPWGAGGSLRNASICVRENDAFDGEDHLLVFAEPHSTVSVGDDCTLLLDDDVTLKGFGNNCRIFYAPPLLNPDHLPIDSLTQVPSVILRFAPNFLTLPAHTTAPAEQP